MSQSLNLLALVKDSDNSLEGYIFLYDDESTEKLLEIFGEYASNKRLRFSYRDAAYLGKKVRKGIKENENQLDVCDKLERMFKKYD